MGVALSLVLAPSLPPAQDQSGGPGPYGERVAIALLSNVAVESVGPWVTLGLRLSVPLGRRAGVHLESSAVFGRPLGTLPSSMTSFIALNVRHRWRPPRENVVSYAV